MSLPNNTVPERNIEKEALEMLKRDPTGASNLTEQHSQDDITLLAMLAGTTAQTLKRSQFADNVASSVVAPVMDPRTVIGNFVKSTPGRIMPGVVSPAPLVTQPVSRPVVAPAADEPQLELDLYRNMNMNDVYNILDKIGDRLSKIESNQKTMIEILSKIEGA